MKQLIFFTVLFSIILSVSCQSNQSLSSNDNIIYDKYKVWAVVDSTRLTLDIESNNLPRHYKVFLFNAKRANTILEKLKIDKTNPNTILMEDQGNKSVFFQFPGMDGNFYDYRIKNANQINANSGKDFPDINSYNGIMINDPETTVKLDVNPNGFYARITSPKSTVFIRPASDKSKYYLCFDSKEVIVDE